MIGVLVSGEGTNLQALLDDGLPVVAVASNVVGAGALSRAEAAGVATASFPLEGYEDRDARDAAMAEWLEARGADLVVCAGYMHLLRPSFLARFPQRVVNVHPAPLPEFRARIRSRTCSRPVPLPPRPPCTSSTTASTPAR